MKAPKWLVVYACLVGAFLVLPTLVVVPLSFTEYTVLRWPPSGFTLDWYTEVLTDGNWRGAAVTSFQVAVLTAISATVLGGGIALAISRGGSRGRSFATLGVLAPMIVPTVIMAVGVYFVFVRWGLVGTIGGLVAAHTVLALPFVVVSVMNALSRIDRNLELAGYSLGAGPFRTFRTITLPQMAPGLLTGAMFAFITSWDEAVVALFLSTPRVRTLPVLIFSQISSGVEPSVAAAASLLLLVTVVLLLLAWITGRAARQRRNRHAN
ncbi:ABC transporter permease [Agromyces silvae]|uniref:ABC transporter permease n=1 Tax=Agromyces silvae TaxID=3388266 RepID=UPI00280B380E|nr:ABC transporter permease [Agromyces protaetiae]